MNKGRENGGNRIFGASQLRLRHYRNYAEESVEFFDGFNVVEGSNAQGKTNLLEALELLATTRVFRGQRDSEAIQDGFEEAWVEATLWDSGTNLKIVLPRTGRKKAFINEQQIPRAADLIGRMPSVSITTEDLAIVRGDPSDRRLALDFELSALYPAYLKALSTFKRALEQRNACLKALQVGHVTEEVLSPWEVQMGEAGALIRASRIDYLATLQTPAEEAHEEIGEGEKLELAYVANDEATTAEGYLASLEAARRTDIHRGSTSVGPHRDDFMLKVDGRDARLFGSQGQQRTALIATRLGSLQLAATLLGGPPLLLLDDILSDLDQHRRRRLGEAIIKRAGQALLTCTEASAVGDEIRGRARVMHIASGKVTPSL